MALLPDVSALRRREGLVLLSEVTAEHLVAAITPFEEPNARLVVAGIRAGAVSILDLGRDPARALGAIADIRRWTAGSRGEIKIGVRIPPGCPISPEELDAQLASQWPGAGPLVVDRVVLARGSAWTAAQAALGGRLVVAEITSVSEAIEAAAAGADELIARGNEGGGSVGSQSSYMLLQSLMDDERLRLPVWAAGGIGMHSAAAAVAGGAVGVVLDVQLALVSEMDLPGPVAAAIAAMDGSETRVIAGHRLYVRPDLPVASLHEDDPDVTPASVALRLGARDLRDQLLPIGQDGALASTFADRHRTAGGVLQAVVASIEEHLVSSVTSRPLSSGSRFASVNGLRHPVAQGPMTRVSDRAAFALSVAQAGGLPFLALAVMSPKEVAALLEETAALFAAHGETLPWGVGILGFVPVELRAAQLEVISAFRPSYALIAGGRPSQAAPLEDVGISTFLHVPTPALMEQFVAAGARKFVVEGRECGGHVGPLSSFSLWDAQVAQLLSCIDGQPELAGELQVLFAGGAHDDRSAAMVAALAAPLAARHVGVGVLMGTAYLFTQEAVTHGAVVPNFQRALLDCQRTVLLETSPGHATRCVDSPYVRAFAEAKHKLLADGASRNEMWASLEELNLGRLRLASKGRRRDAGRMVEVTEVEQSDQGMFMTGEAATLRRAVTTLASLHAEVTDGATEFLETVAATHGIVPRGSSTQPEASKAADPLDIAIVGMACVFPQAADLASYWANVLGGRDSITDVAPDRWNHELYYDPDHDPLHPKPDSDVHTPSKSGGFLPPIPFDALGFGIPPTSLTGIETVQLLALDVAAKALRDAGYGERPFDRSEVAVFFGAEAGNDLSGAYGLRSLYPGIGGKLPPALDDFLPRMTEDSFPGVLGNVIAGRIANRLDLGGSNYTVDAACASSLAALDAGCKDLRAGTSTMVLCGGADLHNGIHDYLLFASVHALSPTGRCRSFDATADGIALGEGVGCIALKRLSDAERDGDRIYAVIRGVGGSSDGRSLGLTAPRAEGQRRAMQRSYAMAGISPAQVGLIEAHGTGTVVGDRTELGALTDLFTEAGTPSGACALGSVKSQIGHTKCAAGIAGVIKAALSIYTGVRPPTINLTRPADGWDPATSPFCFDQEARVWSQPPQERIAGVSAFGFGGTNFHALLGGYSGAPEPSQTLDQWPAELFLFHGADRDQAGLEVDRLTELIGANDEAGRPWRLRDLALTVSVRPGPVQLAVVADDLDDLAAKLANLQAQGLGREPINGNGRGTYAADETGDLGEVAFLFPGQGSQRPGMLSDLFVAFPATRTHLEAGRKWVGAMFPPAAFTPERLAAQHAAITDTRVAQPTLGMAGAALCDLLASVGVRPGMTAGHSYGELLALRAAGVLDDDTLLDLSEARALAILAATQGTEGAMAAVRGAANEVRSALAGADRELAVVIANHNAPQQVVLSGAAAEVDEAVRHLASCGFTATRIPVACAFHSPLVAGADATLLAYLERIDLQAPTCPVWSNTTATLYPADPGEIGRTLARQVVEPVLWVDQIEAMYAAGARTFVEVGPGRTLSQFVGRILGERAHAAIPCDVPGEHGVRRLLMALAELSVRGVPVDAAALFSGRDANVVNQTSVPRRPGWTIDGSLVRGADGNVLKGGLQPAPRGPLVSLGGSGVQAAGSGGGDRDATVLEFLRTTRELVAAQRDVVLGYLGAPLPAAAVPAHSDLIGAALEISGAGGLEVSQHAVVAEPSARPEPEVLNSEQLSALLLEIVSQRTGYPMDMLDPRADLEADLSIDSIKRTEILGEVAARAGMTGGSNGSSRELDPRAIEELAALKTIEAIASWIIGMRAGTPEIAGPAGGQLQLSAGAPVSEVPAAGDLDLVEPAVGAGRPERFVVRVDQCEPDVSQASDRSLDGQRIVVVADARGVGLTIADLLEDCGAEVERSAVGAALLGNGQIDGMVYLAALDGGPPVLPDAYELLRTALLRGAARLLLVTGGGGTFGHQAADPPADQRSLPAAIGLPGLARTLSREFPEVLVRLVDIDPDEPVNTLAGHLMTELLQGPRTGAPTVIGRTRDRRTALKLVAAPLAPALSALDLGPDSVVLLTGGARGITARAAIALARVSGCHLELIGRAPLPASAEAADIAAASGPIEVRRALIGRGMKLPAAIEAETRRLLSAREIRSNLTAFAEVAASVGYHQADVRDAAAIQAAVGAVLDRHGRIDGVIHGAGVLDDRLVRDKTAASFADVFDPKVAGAEALANALEDGLATRDLRALSFFVLFGSISGVFGNRGQADYSAANDALGALSRHWAGRFAGQVVCVDWGPWETGDGGMVSADLKREYERRGIGLIDPDEGVACLLAELAAGQDGMRVRDRASQVVYICGDLDAYQRPTGPEIHEAATPDWVAGGV